MTIYAKRIILILAISTLFGFTFSQAATPDLPGVDAVVEKGGVWAIAGILMWWVLGKLSGQIDRMINSVDKLAEKIEQSLK